MGSDGIQTNLHEQVSRFGADLAGWRFSLDWHTSWEVFF